MSAVNKDHFIPSFPIQVLYLPSCLTALGFAKNKPKSPMEPRISFLLLYLEQLLSP